MSLSNGQEVTTNTISGRVIHKESSLGIPNLLVVVYSSVSSTPILSAPLSVATATTSNQVRLFSGITDFRPGNEGGFQGNFADVDFKAINPQETRPNLHLTVYAPEEPSVMPQDLILFSGVLQRDCAAREEGYIILLTTAQLQKAGIPIPLDPSVAKEEPQAIIDKMKQAVDFHVTLQQAARRIATQQVEVARTNAMEIDAVVQSRLIESLTGVTASEAEKLNIVLPGTEPEATVWKTVNKSIEKNVNSTPLAGYLVLTEDEAQQFRDANGNYRNQIPAAEIEPFLYNPSTDTKRTTSIIRFDPITALCRQHDAPDSLLISSNSQSTTSSTSSNGSTPIDQPIKPQDLPKFIGRIINQMTAPEQNPVFGGPGRPTSSDIQNSVQTLQLGGGPADVTAFYDYHQLQIAFDFVWQHVIDEGILETGKALGRQLIDQGSNVLPLLQNGADPVKILRNEVGHVTTAQKLLKTAGVAYRMAANGLSNGSNGATGLPPSPPPSPPVIKRPFNMGDIAVRPGQIASTPDPNDLLAELDDLLNEQYKFEVFAPGSSNFGLLITYRQKWDPISYQVGDLVKTLTLAPKETRKVTSRRTIKRERSIKELQDNQHNRKDEIKDTMRDEAEIVQRAQNKTNFSLTAHGSFDIVIADGDATTTLTRDADSSSQETKKSFHEAVLNAAQEFKDERKLEVETKETFDEEVTDSAELTNPNDELTVTYLFYELQRRYLVSEHIHRLTPVALVAMEVPNPNRSEIDKILLAHSWIINRVLLDDRYRAPLNYLCTRIVGDELALQQLGQKVADVRQAVAQLTAMYKEISAQMEAREHAVEDAMTTRAKDIAHDDSQGIGESAWHWVVGKGEDQDVQAAQVVEQRDKDAYERKVAEVKDLRMRLDAETAALDEAVSNYAKAYAEHANHLLEIAGLRVHFKENMLYYMQAIWSFTFRDQIYFSLCNTKVPKLTAAQKTYSINDPAQIPLSITPKPGQVVLEVHADVQLTSNLDPQQDFVTLAEAADLDHPLGYKGNCIIFPLNQSNALTDYMMVPYLDSELGIHDPDDLGSWTPEDFVKYARCLQERLKDELSPSEYAALQNQLTDQYKRIITNPRITSDEVIVPTTSLYIEALPGAHPLLENFKLQHRALDVQKAEEEVRKMQMENLRYASRIISNKLDDPEIEKKILIEGGNNVVVPAGDQ